MLDDVLDMVTKVSQPSIPDSRHRQGKKVKWELGGYSEGTGENR